MNRGLFGNNGYTAIVIAAGLSSRMDDFKPLLDIGEKPALFRLLDAIDAAGIERIAVVTGHGHETIEHALANRSLERSAGSRLSGRYSHETHGVCSAASDTSIDLVFNEVYESGMFSSIQTGIRRIAAPPAANADPSVIASEAKQSTEPTGAGNVRAALLFPVDVPLVSAETIRGLIAAYEEGGASGFAVPVFRGTNGHPLLIPRAYFGEILDYAGGDGLKAVRNRHDAEMIRYETEDEGCVLDMDTPEDYKRILEYDKRNRL